MPNYKDIEDTIFFLKKMISRKEEHIKRTKKEHGLGELIKSQMKRNKSDFLRWIIKAYRAKFCEWQRKK